MNVDAVELAAGAGGDEVEELLATHADVDQRARIELDGGPLPGDAPVALEVDVGPAAQDDGHGPKVPR
jgi:hypothetical protein